MTTETQSPDPAQALLAQALEDIIEPFAYIERNLPEGYRLDGHAALQQINSREFYTRIAKEALAAYRDRAIPAPEGALRAAAAQALDALEQLQGGCTDSDDGTVECITVWCPEIIDALRAALAAPAPQAPVALPDVDLCRVVAAHEVYQYHPGALHEFAHEVIAEFCRLNGITAPQTKEPTNDR